MPPFEKLAFMAFDAIFALIDIKLAKLEFRAPSLFIFVIGCGLLVFTYFLSEGQQQAA